jgi:DNA-binding NtrC family response regulator
VAYSLVVVSGASPGTILQLDAKLPAVTIGRHSVRDLQLDDDRVSRLHARLVYRANHWSVEDCGSLNGTFVNSQSVQQTMLEPGDLIRIGDSLILFTGEDRDPGGEPGYADQPRPTAVMGLKQDAQRELAEHSLSGSLARVQRDSAVLCRMANLLQQHPDTESLLRVALDALVQGVAPDAASLWLVGTDGRLRCVGRFGQADEEHLLASLALEKNKALFVEPPNLSPSALETSSPVGSGIGVPIPGASCCRGAIECHRAPEHGLFQRGQLDFAVVVAYQLGTSLENLEHRERLEQANDQLRRQLASQTKLAGSSPAMQAVLERIARVGPTSSTVLILGESGTGKELVARAIHEISRCSAGPYVPVNCAAFSESLLESELFGHEVGAFTGADRRHIGQFERAHRGTIFLDEIGEMSPSCQAKLLRVLEGHPFQRLGGQESIHAEVRVIAATHRDLIELVGQGRFREDLYYRLRVIDLPLPPLRERGEDVIELAALFLDQFRRQVGRGPRRLSAEAIAAIRQHPWAGNIRELKNAVERAVVLGPAEEVSPQDLGLAAMGRGSAPGPDMISLREAERRHIEYVLGRVAGNKAEACRVLGMGRGTLYKKLQEYGISDAS